MKVVLLTTYEEHSIGQDDLLGVLVRHLVEHGVQHPLLGVGALLVQPLGHGVLHLLPRQLRPAPHLSSTGRYNAGQTRQHRKIDLALQQQCEMRA